MMKEVLGEQRIDYAVGLTNLAVLLHSQGDYAAARQLFEQALAIKKQVVGERHPAYAQSLHNLAYLLSAQGDYAAARPLYEQALAIRKETLGDRQRDYATSLNNLARSAQIAGRLYCRAVAVRADPFNQKGCAR